MSLFTRYAKAFTGMSPDEQRAAILEQNFIDEGFSKGAQEHTLASPLTQKDTDTWLEQLNVNPRMSGLNKIISDNGVTPFGIYYNDSKKGKIKVKDHPLELELKQSTVPMFFSLWTAYRYMTGEVYITYDLEKGVPTNFHVFTSTHLVHGGIREGYYTFRKGDKQVKYPEDRVIIDYDIELTNPYNKGFGKAASIMNEVEADTYILRYLTQFYVNSARPDAFIIPVAKAEQDLPDQETLNRLATRLRDFHKGWANAHKMAILSFEAKVESIPTNHREMDLLETRRMYRDTSHQHFGIPPEIVGIVEDSNKATVVAAEHIYAKQVREPLLHHFEDIINSKVLPKFSQSEHMYFEFVNILPDDDELNLEKASEGEKAKTITINEHRELLGLPRIDGDYGRTMVGTEYNVEEHGHIEVVQSEPYETIPYEKMRTHLLAKANNVDENSIVSIKIEGDNDE